MVNKKRRQMMDMLPQAIRQRLEHGGILPDKVQEIRLREDRPLIVCEGGKEVLLPHRVTKEELRDTLEHFAEYSLYAYEHELRQGFITVEGGHRVGVAGKIIPEEGKVRNFQYISSVNIRVCHEILGCADPVFPGILQDGRICHTLIISPPGCGKTTLLRDMIRQISDGNRYIEGKNVGVVDERSELGGCYQGVPQNQLGLRTDILDNCPKAEGMMLMIRSMSPQVLAVDEIGSQRDVEAVTCAMHCGVIILATAHGDSLEEIREKPFLKELAKGHYFERYVLLGGGGGPGKIRGIYDERGRQICS
ncbi:stage III sporulation protein AA [Roseburia hominis]